MAYLPFIKGNVTFLYIDVDLGGRIFKNIEKKNAAHPRNGGPNHAVSGSEISMEPSIRHHVMIFRFCSKNLIQPLITGNEAF